MRQINKCHRAGGDKVFYAPILALTKRGCLPRSCESRARREREREAGSRKRGIFRGGGAR